MRCWRKIDLILKSRIHQKQISSRPSFCKERFLKNRHQTSHVLIPRVCECYLVWQRNSAEGIKDLDMGRWSRITQGGPKYSHKYPSKRQAGGGSTGERRQSDNGNRRQGCPLKMREEPQAKENGPSSQNLQNHKKINLCYLQILINTSHNLSSGNCGLSFMFFPLIFR